MQGAQQCAQLARRRGKLASPKTRKIQLLSKQHQCVGWKGMSVMLFPKTNSRSLAGRATRKLAAGISRPGTGI
jgi:hypothetical protein